MNTKKNYVAPATDTIEMKYVATILAGSNEFGAGASLEGRGELEDDYTD